MSNQAVNFSDVFKSSFIEKMTSISFLDMLIAMSLAFVLGLFIMQVYKKTFKGVMYSSTFSMSLMALTLIILGVTSNVVLSLGMVGALSIVRFRSAVKEPMDIAFLFWSISEGIVLGAGLIPLAVLGAIFIGIIMVLFANKETTDNPYILVVNCDSDSSENKILEKVGNSVSKYCVKSKTVSPTNGIEMTVEVKLKNITTNFVNEISCISGVSNVVLVSYNGDYMA
ncbi:hypothetical protein C671_0041 [[Clostridium] bifermentans ATCC 19299]|uniref:DUF4956 domain-containing protein n=1 Tax=Paraclostridium bifermentans TaxID=1490 RepID=UPI00038D31A3|nr:DUF4956 domain-containing protein [Paraclostridium bifermentans]EQK49528.1 hypothetical protein C671_0041 [[Clostridium] bifermentans ATCC 19299] [Paraclostridium bifermentans ATCC 19299]